MTASPAAADRLGPLGKALYVGLGLGLIVAVGAVAAFALRPKERPDPPPAGETSAARLTEAIEVLDRLDPRWRFGDLEADRTPPPDEGNAAPQVSKAARLIPDDWDEEDFAAAHERLRGPKADASLRAGLKPVAAAVEEARKLAPLRRG